MIGNLNVSTQIDMISAFCQPDIELGVLVVREAFVVSTDGSECLDRHQGVVPMVDPAASGLVAMGRATIAEDRVLGCGCGSFEASVSCGIHADDHRVSLCPCLDLQQLLAVAIRICGVGINPDQKPNP